MVRIIQGVQSSGMTTPPKAPFFPSNSSNHLTTTVHNYANNTFSYLTKKEWRQSLKSQITEIGKTDPEKASKLSHAILSCVGKPQELAALRQQGLKFAITPPPPGLLGGMENEQQVQKQNPETYQPLPEGGISEILTYLGIKDSPSLALTSKWFYEIYSSSYVQTSLAYQGAFGPGDWSRYFGEVGEVPPLPDDIGEILNSPCPYWEGQRVQDTHLLVLIPETVNGVPLTLNSLGEMIKTPQGGGHKATYRFYGGNVKRELGGHPNPMSHWVLFTRDVLPNSRHKTYPEQRQLLKNPGTTLSTLDAATAILMHHAKTGNRLYSDSPDTYTRCQEKVYGNKYCVVVGSFGSSGLFVCNNFFDVSRNDALGLCGCRKFTW